LSPAPSQLPPPSRAARVIEGAAALGASLGVKAVELARVTLWSPGLLAADLRYGLLSLLRSPYRAGAFEQHLLARRRGGDVDEYIFGETPWFTLRRILRRAGLGSGDLLIDIGAGDGRVLLFAALQLGARAIGYEVIAERADTARRVLAACAIDGVTVVHGDGFDADLSGADVVYCAWTCFSPQSRSRLGEVIESLHPGARLITVTHPVVDDRVESLGTERAWFGWGRSDVYYYRRR